MNRQHPSQCQAKHLPKDNRQQDVCKRQLKNRNCKHRLGIRIRRYNEKQGCASAEGNAAYSVPVKALWAVRLLASQPAIFLGFPFWIPTTQGLYW